MLWLAGPEHRFGEDPTVTGESMCPVKGLVVSPKSVTLQSQAHVDMEHRLSDALNEGMSPHS